MPDSGIPNGIGGLPDSEERRLIRRAFMAGLIAGLPWAIAAVGWSLGWNPYFNLMLTLGGGVVIFTGIAATLDRYRHA